MVARMVGYAPDRILAAVEYAPGHWEPIGIDTVKLPEAALSVPQFIIVNGADNICGTQRPYAYFEQYHHTRTDDFHDPEQRAAWLRNESHPNSPLVAGGCDRTTAPHCCDQNTRAD
jgi:hypothetical protein